MNKLQFFAKANYCSVTLFTITISNQLPYKEYAYEA